MMLLASEDPQAELPELSPEHVPGVIHALEQLSDEELIERDPTAFITIIAHLPKGYFSLKKAYVEALYRMYLLQKEKPAIATISLSAWQRFKALFSRSKPEIISPKKIQLCGTKATINLSRVDSTHITCQPNSQDGEYAAMTIPFRPDEDIDQYLWIIENMSSDLQKQLADQITYTREQVDNGGMEIYVQQAIQNPF